MRRIVPAIFAALVVILLAVPAHAGNCSYVSHSYTPTYQQSYYSPSYVNVVTQAFPYYVPLQTFSSVGDDARNFYTTKDAVKQGTLEALREFQAGGGGTVNPPPLAPQMGSPPLAAPNASPPPVGIVAQAKKVFTGSCVKCHNPSDRPDLLDLTKDVFTQFDSRFYKSVSEQWGDILRRVVDEGGKDSMPPNGKQLAQADMNTILQATGAAYAGAAKIPPAQKEPRYGIEPYGGAALDPKK